MACTHDVCLRAVLGVALFATASCGGGPPRRLEGIVRDARTGKPIAGARVRVDANGGATATSGADGKWVLTAPGDADLVAEAPGRCPAKASAASTPVGRKLTLHMSERLSLGDDHAQVGFDHEVVLHARTPCDADVRVEWRQVAGKALGGRMRVLDSGRRVVARTHALHDMVTLEDRLSVVTFSPEQRGEYRFQARLRAGGERGESIVREVRVTAAPTSAGVYQVPTGADMYLNAGNVASPEWELASKPEGSRAVFDGVRTRTPRLRPDRFGQYLVRFVPTNLVINIMAGDYERVPRDCGRPGCHQTEDTGWETTRHARAFRRGVEGELGPTFDERCWQCHATGVDPGVHNGGLHETAARLGWQQGDPGAGAWDRLPRQVRRHGSVWCSACHGPGRILPPQFHWEYGAKYQAGVCARCHEATLGPDVPHPLPSVAEWRRAPMASFVGGAGVGPREDDPALRVGCAMCHSAQGFVQWRRHGDLRYEPEPGTVAAIACAACHDPHDGTRPHALRMYDASDPVSGTPVQSTGAGALCMSCHRAGVARASETAAAPHAPQADVLVGRGARLVRSALPAVHGAIAQACVTCHMAQPGATLAGRAGGHTFSIRDLDATDRSSAALSASGCAGASCHANMPADLRSIGAGRDRDGDEIAGTIGIELDRAIARARAAVRAAVVRANLRDTCPLAPRTATDVVERDARLVLVGADGHALGDCDADGRERAPEHWLDASALPTRTRDAAWDLSLIEKDGSHGMHNPAFSFTVLGAVATVR